MNKEEIKERIFIEGILRQAISDDYSNEILDEIYNDVIEDLRASADEDYNEDDVRLAFGRVILDRLKSWTRVYRVYDDEWEDYMGDKQIRDFAIDQLCDKAEDFIFEAQEGYKDEEDGKRMEDLFNKVTKENYTNLTIDEIEFIFEAFDFDYEEVFIQ